MKISAYDPKEVIKIYANVNELDIKSKLDTLKESYIFKAEKVIKHKTWDGSNRGTQQIDIALIKTDKKV